ncbi:hypothetical protein HID58_055314 [Brassica napus]|uniref:Uncharacterized protein n=1 Tax=Brassica napus TaxID=3708 RepID=A0ABQ8ALH3_BRANA|nr:hypothetical protein HID58_055314 [Brassica napus]
MRKNRHRLSSGDGTKTKRGFGGGTTRKRSSSPAARTQFGHLKHCRRLAGEEAEEASRCGSTGPSCG